MWISLANSYLPGTQTTQLFQGTPGREIAISSQPGFLRTPIKCQSNQTRHLPIVGKFAGTFKLSLQIS